MGASGKWLKSLLSHSHTKTLTSTTHQEMCGSHNKSNKKNNKWKIWRKISSSESEGSSDSTSMKINKVAAAAAASDSSSLTSAVAAVVQAPPKDFMLIKQESAAIRIQSLFRAFLARQAFRALRAVVKLQAIFRGHLVRKQAAVTLRCMQALVRVQAHVRARNVRNSPEGKAVQEFLDDHRNLADSLKPIEQGWCDIPGTVDEVKVKLRMRQEGAIKRDRAMAYSISTQSRLGASPSQKATKAVTLLKHQVLDNKSLGNSLLERWMEVKPWESPIFRKSEEFVPHFQQRKNGVTTRISVLRAFQPTPSTSTISSENMNDDSPVSTSWSSGSPSMPFTNTVKEAADERDVHQPSYMNLTASTKAKLKTYRCSSQNSKKPVMEDCVSHNTSTTFLNRDTTTTSNSGSDPSANYWKDICATPLRGSYRKRNSRS